MEPVPQEVIARTIRARIAFGTQYSVLSNQYSPSRLAYNLVLALALILLCNAGCVTMDTFLYGPPEGPPKGMPTQISMNWHNQVIFAPDQTHAGAPTPGLTGRLYLFGPNMNPLAGDGSVTVDLFDPSQLAPDGSPKPLERWNLKNDLLQRCLTRDTIGWGYTLLLPWGTYRPDLAQVVLKMHYDPPQGAPMYANPATVAFNPVQEIHATTASRPINTPAKNGGVVQASQNVTVTNRSGRTN